VAVKAKGLAAQLPSLVQQGIGDLVRSMNCYYSNLIEGHDTHPRDIDRALSDNYSSDAQKRALQLEAVAHIAVQWLIDHNEDLHIEPTRPDYILWLHKEFCKRLPEEMLWVENPDTNEKLRVVPDELRTGWVQVGRHIPPEAKALPRLLDRFSNAYDVRRLSKLRRIIATAAAHHRFLWIHPFYDDNGRVVRLMSHASLQRCGVGSSLWSVSRGLARNVDEYKAFLMAADKPRQGDLDGRGALSTKALVDFCVFFLNTCIDQIEFMTSLMEPNELLRCMQIYVEEETMAGRMRKGSFPLLREALLTGEVPRGRAGEITGYGERMARYVVSDLLKEGYLKSDTTRGPLKLGFPIGAVERWFPRLYPAL
jgi:Fic family protein